MEAKLLEARARELGLEGSVWGLRGLAAIERIERGLGVTLSRSIREFVTEVGNFSVGPFEIVVGGDESGSYSAVTQTMPLWEINPGLKSNCPVQIMIHAGEIYLNWPETDSILAYDSMRPVVGEETMKWDTFAAFLDWLFQEAVAIEKCNKFQ